MTRAARAIAVAAALAQGLAIGCSHAPTDAALEKIYRPGLTRTEAAALHADAPVVVVRPPGGWGRATDDRGAAAFAQAFENKTGALVQTCEVYWVPRGLFGMGVYWDYLFFGSDDRLLGHRRRFVD